MDAVEFIKERSRMCKSFYSSEYGNCGDCPAKWDECDEMRVMTEDEPNIIVEIVEKWAAAHPHKTRQSEFLKQWPEVVTGAGGIIAICPAHLDKAYAKAHCISSLTNANCDNCRREFWSQEVE